MKIASRRFKERSRGRGGVERISEARRTMRTEWKRNNPRGRRWINLHSKQRERVSSRCTRILVTTVPHNCRFHLSLVSLSRFNKTPLPAGLSRAERGKRRRISKGGKRRDRNSLDSLFRIRWMPKKLWRFKQGVFQVDVAMIITVRWKGFEIISRKDKERKNDCFEGKNNRRIMECFRDFSTFYEAPWIIFSLFYNDPLKRRFHSLST